MDSKFVVYLSLPRPRLRARRVDEVALAEQVRDDALRTGQWQFVVRHGGSVSRAYKHDALTEAALVVADPAGRVIVWVAKLPASKVTLGGSAEVCYTGMRPLFDLRFSEKAQSKARQAAKEKHQESFPQSTYARLLLQDNEF